MHPQNVLVHTALDDEHHRESDWYGCAHHHPLPCVCLVLLKTISKSENMPKSKDVILAKK